jgi:hypothetical protein
MSKDKKMTKAQHRKRHKELHLALDELVADFILDNNDKLPSQSTVFEIMRWSHEQTKNPSDKTHY